MIDVDAVREYCDNVIKSGENSLILSDINKNIDKEDNVVMFVYDDKKIFEKSKAYRVSI